MIIKEAFTKLQADLPAAERIQRVCVYGGASEGQWDGYVDAAKRLGEVLGEAGLDVAHGGGRTGMMGAMADGALAKDAHVIGVIPDFLDQVEVGHRDVTDLRLVPDMHTRKRMMFDLARVACAISVASQGSMSVRSFALSLPGDQLINVEFATTMAAVPLPAGGALLLTELGALGFARSRRRAS